MRHSALLAWRSPPSWALTLPLVLPDPAGTGATPHRWAHAPSECNRSGLSPAAITSAAAVSGPTPKSVEKFGDGGDEEGFDPFVELGEFASSASMRCASEDRDALVAAVTGSGDRVGRSLDSFGDQCRHREALETATKLLWGGVAEVAHLDECLDPGLAGRALGDDEDPDGLDGTVSRLRAAARSTAESGAGGFDGVEGIRLAAATALLSVRSIDFDDLDANSAQVAGQSRPIRACALDADLGHVPESLEPGQQRLVAGGVGRKALRAEQPAERIEGGGHMDVEVRVDTTSHATRSFYDGHGHPSLLTELGMARPFRIGATGGPGCC